MEKEKEIELFKTYNFPKFKVINHKSVYIVVFFEKAMWIVLDNNKQLEIFNKLNDGSTIQSIIDLNIYEQNDLVWVLTQIEAKNIIECECISIFDNERLHLHLTNKCNLRCPHCYMNSGVANKNELTTNQIKKLCYDFKKNGGKSVSLTGGEPFMRTDFFELVEYISNLDLVISIYTNGCLWKEEDILNLSKYNIDGVQISIDGYDEESNAIVRGNGSFVKSLEAIDLFRKHNIYVIIATTAPYEILMNNSQKYIDFSLNILNKYKNDIRFEFSYYFMPGRNLTIEEINKNKEIYFNKVDEVVKAIYGDTSEDDFIANIIGNQLMDSCGYGSLNVMSNGDYYFCDRISSASKIGNVVEDDFDDICSKSKIAEKLGSIDNFKPCNVCELKYICGGGCRVDHFEDFTKINNIYDVDFDKIKPRICTVDNKIKIYDLMLKTNERFFD